MRGPNTKPLSGYILALHGAGAGAASLASAVAAHLPNAMTAGALLLAYVGLEWVSFIHEYKGVPVTPWNPGLGVAFAFLVLKGARYALVLLAGVAIAEIFVLRTDLAWPVIVGMAAIVSASFATAAVVARRHLRLDIGLSHVRDVLLLLVAGAAAAAASAVLLSSLLLVADELKVGDLPKASIPLLVGDVIGIAVVTPLLLRLSLRWPDLTARSMASLVSRGVALSGGHRSHLVAGRGRRRSTRLQAAHAAVSAGAGGRAAARHRRLVRDARRHPARASSPCCIKTDMTRACSPSFSSSCWSSPCPACWSAWWSASASAPTWPRARRKRGSRRCRPRRGGLRA